MSIAQTLLETHPERFGLWPSVWKLLRLRARIWWNNFKRSKLRAKIGTIVVLVLVLAGMGLLFFLSSQLLRFLRSPALAELIDPAAFLSAIPTMVLTGAFVVVVLTNFGVLLQALYLSHDMDFLVTSPLPMRAVFMAKMLEAILPTFVMFCAFSLPVLIGLGVSSGFHILYYPMLVLLLALLALAAGGLASILVMAVVRVAPARRVAEVLGFLGATTSILCGQSGNLINAANVDQTDVAGALSAFTRIQTPYSPLAWAGRGLDAIGAGDLLTGLALSGAAALLAGAIFAGTLTLAERLYYTGWSSMQGSLRIKRPAGKPAAVPRRGGPLLRLLPAPVLAVVWKDLLLLRRDPRNVSQLITPLIIGFVMIFSTQRGGRNVTRELTELGLQDLEVYGLLLLAALVGWMLMMNLATLAFSREGKNYWMLKIAPIHPAHLLAGKFLVAYVPTLLFSMLYLVVAFLIRGAPLGALPYTVFVTAMTLAGGVGISLAFGVAGANLTWDSPQRQRLTGSAGCLVFLAIIGYYALVMALFLLPPGLMQVFTGSTPLWATLAGAAVGSAAAALCVLLPLRMVVSRLARIGEA
jgi:ABC-2 type transport system permease protein